MILAGEEIPIRQAEASLCRRSLARFVRKAWPIVEPGIDICWNWHLDAICQHLEAVTRAITNARVPADQRWEGPEIRRLLINVPPGHMKSLLVSVFWPAWMWTRWPWLRYVFSSYALPLALRDSVRTRDIIESDWYRDTFRPKWTMKPDQNAKGSFINTAQGKRDSVSVGSGATGFRGDLVVVDDPLNAVDARSEIALEEATWWWDKAMSSRLNDMRYGARVVIMQRLHEDDLSAHCLRKTGPGAYSHLCLPSEFEPDRRSVIAATGWADPRTEPGELLFPIMFNKQVLDEARQDMGSDAYAGQHQQRPAPAEGGFYKRRWFRYYRRVRLKEDQYCYLLTDPATGQTRRVLESDCWTLIVADTAMKSGTLNDYWCAGVWHVEKISTMQGHQVGTTMILRDLWRERCDFPAGETALKSLAQRYRPDFMGVEDKASGTIVIQRFRASGLPIRGIRADADKVTRAATSQVWVEGAKVWLPLDSPWLGDFQDELLTFPNGRNDDQVDMLAHSVNFANNKDLWVQPPPKTYAPNTFGALAGHDQD